MVAEHNLQRTDGIVYKCTFTFGLLTGEGGVKT